MIGAHQLIIHDFRPSPVSFRKTIFPVSLLVLNGLVVYFGEIRSVHYELHAAIGDFFERLPVKESGKERVKIF